MKSRYRTKADDVAKLSQEVGEQRAHYGGTRRSMPIRITVDLDPSLHRRLKVRAANDGRRLSELIRDWIDQNCADF